MSQTVARAWECVATRRVHSRAAARRLAAYWLTHVQGSLSCSSDTHALLEPHVWARWGASEEGFLQTRVWAGELQVKEYTTYVYTTPEYNEKQNVEGVGCSRLACGCTWPQPQMSFVRANVLRASPSVPLMWPTHARAGASSAAARGPGCRARGPASRCARRPPL